MFHKALIKDYPNTKIVNVIHDEILSETSDSDAEAVLALQVKCMEDAGNMYTKKVRIQADGGIGMSWADKP